MRPMTNKILGTLAALLLGATLATAQAPDTSNMTVVTFSGPVSLPGVTLPAGSYLFKLADSQVNRNIVQVFEKDRSKILATILAIPAERNEPADETVITFAESPANTAPAIRYWYYPGQRRGQEFAYPKRQAQEIANAAHTSVLSIDTEDTSADAMTKSEMSRVEPGAEASQSAAQSAQPSTSPGAATAQPQPATPQSAAQPTQPPTTEQPSAETPSPSTPSAASTTPSPSTSSTSTQTREQGAVGTSGSTSGRTSLPKTASTLPLVGLAGLLALVSAFGVGAFRRAHA